MAGFATLLAEANNAALRQLAAAMPNVELVDEFQISDVLAADPHALGFRADLTATWQDLLDAGSIRFAPNEVAFFNGIHPTTAAHGVLAAFADAVLTADHVQFPDETNDIVRAGPGDNFIFVPPNPGASGPITIFGGCGDDVIFAGSGDVTVHGGSGNDLIFSGSGNVHLEAGNGTDVLATNSLGTNILAGGNGDDALIVNRGGTNTITGGKGADLFVLKEDASLVNADGSFRFGEQVISGGRGSDTLRFIINDQDPNLESALITEFQKIEAEFDAVDHGAFSFDGLTVSGIERLELQVDSVSRDPVTPWLITHGTVLSDGHAAPTS
jgi:Ca2+-binding RTX toxin-like protein